MSEKRSTYVTGYLPVDNSQLNERKKNIEKVQQDILELQTDCSLIQLMDFLEKIIGCCGGESKPTFLEVHRDMVRVFTRVPLQANLYPFLPESHESNMKFHRKVTEMCLLIDNISGVRWVPVDGGSQVVVIFKK